MLSSTALKTYEDRAVEIVQTMDRTDPVRAMAFDNAVATLHVLEHSYSVKAKARGLSPKSRARIPRFCLTAHGDLRAADEFPSGIDGIVLPRLVILGWGNIELSIQWRCLKSGRWQECDVDAADMGWLRMSEPGRAAHTHKPSEPMKFRLDGVTILDSFLKCETAVDRDMDDAVPIPRCRPVLRV